jgi:hypothetical protein
MTKQRDENSPGIAEPEPLEAELEKTEADSPADVTAAQKETVPAAALAPVAEDLEITARLPRISVLVWPEIAEERPGTPLPKIPALVKEANTPLPSSAKSRAWQHWFKDPWLPITFLVACIASITSLWYFFQNHQILLLGDTYSHMLIARRLIDNLTPGVAQLGGVWLPLPHILMLPFIWNDYLWHTGLAGSFVSMPCYVVSAVYLFLTARRLTHNSRASFIGTLLFILNPNILYLQTTPLSELVLIATLTMASYYFLAWAQEEKLNYLIWAAASTFLATVARYDGWVLFVASLVLIVLIGWIKHQRRAQIEANLLTFGILGGLGIVLWFLWCEVIFGDPLYWQHSSFSSQAQQHLLPQRQLLFLRTKILFTYHDFWQSLRTYTLDSIHNVGLILFVLAVIAIIVFFLRRRVTPEMLAVSLFLVPFAFYVLSLYTGQAIIFVPGASPEQAPQSLSFYNVRYGVEMVAPAAVFLATLASRWPIGRRQIILQVVLSITVIVQTALTVGGGIISLQESQYGIDCAPLHPMVVYLAQHYSGGRILEDTFSSGVNSLGSDVGVDFKDIIYEGSGELWNQALNNPASMVDWVIVNPRDPTDLVAKQIDVRSQTFLSQFTLIVQEESGLSLFQRNGLPPLPMKPVPPNLLTEHRLCGVGSSYYESNALDVSSKKMMYKTQLARGRAWKAGY